MTSNSRVVVIGAGPRGRHDSPGGSANSACPRCSSATRSTRPYNRVLLAEVLAGRYSPDVIALPAPDRSWSGPGSPASTATARVLACADGSRSPTARSSWPPAPTRYSRPCAASSPRDHVLPEGVHAFRTMDDCLGLSKAVRPGVRAVVIGGGLLGVSAARALAVRGAQVVLAQQAERLMERQLDPNASAAGAAAPRGPRRRGPHRVPGCATCAASAAPSGRSRWPTATPSTPTSWCWPAGSRPRAGLAQAAGTRRPQGHPRRRRLRTSRPAHPRRSATAPSTTGPCTVSPPRPSNRPTRWPRRWPGDAGLPLHRHPRPHPAHPRREQRLRPRRVRRDRAPPGRRRRPARRRHPRHLPQGRRPRRPPGRRGPRRRTRHRRRARPRLGGSRAAPPDGGPLLHLLTNDGGS